MNSPTVVLEALDLLNNLCEVDDSYLPFYISQNLDHSLIRRLSSVQSIPISASVDSQQSTGPSSSADLPNEIGVTPDSVIIENATKLLYKLQTIKE